MARTPTYQAKELEALLGPRGNLRASSINRALVQKWLTASGVPAVKAKAYGLEQLNVLYNDTTDHALNTARLAAAEPEFTLPEIYGEIEKPVSSPAVPPMTIVPNSDVQEALETLMAALNKPAQHSGPAISQEDINAAVAKAVKDNMARPMQITIKDIQHVVPGQLRHNMFKTVLTAVTCGNVALIGPAGSGKTTLAEQVAEALGVPFYFTGAISSEYKLTGFTDAQGRVVRTAFREAYEHGGLFLFDEIDASQAGAILAFNAALANGHADFPDSSVKRHKDFYCIAAANTYWTGADRVYVGRNQLDGATLDRFIFIELDYDETLERALAANDDWVDTVQETRRKVNELKIRHIVSPRASIMGAKLLAQGVKQKEVEKMVLYKGLDVEQVRKVKGA